MAEHYYAIYDWMTDDLRLCGIELTVFALIHSFTETGREYDGSLAYIAQRTGTTRRNAIRMLQKLVEKNLLLKTERFVNGVKYCGYRVPDDLSHPLSTDRRPPVDEPSQPPLTDRHAPVDEPSQPPLTDRHAPVDEPSQPPLTDRHAPVDGLSPYHKEYHKTDHKEYHEREKKDAREHAAKAPSPQRSPYGEYGNVMLTEEELVKLKQEFPRDWQRWIELLSAYMASSGKRYQNHLATIRRWAMRDEKEKPQESPYAFLACNHKL